MAATSARPMKSPGNAPDIFVTTVAIPEADAKTLRITPG